MIAPARLVKRATDDGLIELADDVPLGKAYRVVMTSRRLIQGYNVTRGKYWAHEMIQDAETGEWLPVELLVIF